MKAKLKVSHIDVQARLHGLFGVTKEQVIEVVERGISGKNECTLNHPLSMPGIRCWAEATAALRELMVPLGWKVDNTDNIASVLHPKKEIKLAVTNADHGTGLEWGHPQPIREKGSGAQRAGYPNQSVLNFILNESLNSKPQTKTTFWYLCIYAANEMVRAEILCPILDDEGTFSDFHERIAIISDQDDYGGLHRITRPPVEPAPEVELDIPVTRKQSSTQ